MHISAITVSFNGRLKKYTVDYLKLIFVNGANLTESYVCSFQMWISTRVESLKVYITKQFPSLKEKRLKSLDF